MHLTILEIAKLQEIFQRLGWSTDDKHIHPSKSAFELISELLAALVPEQRELIYKLLPSYRWIKADQYYSLIEKVLQKIPSNFFDGLGTIFVVPVAHEEKHTKSGTLFLYPVARTYLPKLGFAKGRIIKQLNLISDLSVSVPTSGIIFLDDFIGTADSAYKSLSLYKSKFPIRTDRIAFVSLLCMEEGQQRLTNRGFSVFAAEFLKKSISSGATFQTDAEKNEALRIMREIETELSVGNADLLGYRGSQSQVTMIRTPDNTFPVYWKDNIKAGKVLWEAPFLR